MKAELSIYPLTSTETQLDLGGLYEPPLGLWERPSMRWLGIASPKPPSIASLKKWRAISEKRSRLLARDRLKLRISHRTDLRILHKHTCTGVPT
jgi:hypothetical protein